MGFLLYHYLRDARRKKLIFFFATDIICRLVKQMYSINNECITWGGFSNATPLIMACAHGQAEVVDFLLTIPEQHAFINEE